MNKVERLIAVTGKLVAEVDGKFIYPQLNDSVVKDSIIASVDDQISNEAKLEEVSRKVLLSKKYLNDTDWYFARESETGESVPAKILSKRSEARLYIRSIEDNI